MKLAWTLLFVATSASAQTMYRCTDPDGTHLSFRAACPAGQIGTKMPRQEAQTIAAPEVDIIAKAIAIKKEQEYQAQMDRANKVNNAIALRQIMVGMYAHEVVSAWGRPHKVNSTQSASGKSEQWVYRRERFRDSYVYLDNDVVRSIQTSD